MGTALDRINPLATDVEASVELCSSFVDGGVKRVGEYVGHF